MAQRRPKDRSEWGRAAAVRLTPSSMSVEIGLAAKIGSVLVHVEEALDPVKGHPFDAVALRSLLADPAVKDWMNTLRLMALLPVKR